MKVSVFFYALFALAFAGAFATAAEVQPGHVVCQIAKTDLSKQVEDEGYYTVLKQYDLTIGQETEAFAAEDFSVSFYTSYVDNDPTKTVYLSTAFKLGDVEVFSMTDTYPVYASRFGTSIAKGDTQYEVLCFK